MQSAVSNKAKIAKRVIEVLDFFDYEHPTATVMDIVRRYDRPQSSTSELLSTLVDLGLLYKDLATRSYTLTPRAAMLGSFTQPDFVRDGRLNGLVDKLATQTHHSVGVFGVIGLETQIFSWDNGEPPLKASTAKGIYGGMQEHLTESAVGWLLLSTIEKQRREGMIRRLNAEAAPDKQFSFPEMVEKVERARDCGYATGPMGFGSIADVCAVLVKSPGLERPMALGMAYEPGENTDTEAMIALMKNAVTSCVDQHTDDESDILQFTAAVA